MSTHPNRPDGGDAEDGYDPAGELDDRDYVLDRQRACPSIVCKGKTVGDLDAWLRDGGAARVADALRQSEDADGRYRFGPTTPLKDD